ncbi:hypothetical protein FB451DRAFT_1360293 [Mycena latifolia]|nr:hypothetical protein FB451DRAFT_1360293 [Mycena latifolia]
MSASIPSPTNFLEDSGVLEKDIHGLLMHRGGVEPLSPYYAFSVFLVENVVWGRKAVPRLAVQIPTFQMMGHLNTPGSRTPLRHYASLLVIRLARVPYTTVPFPPCYAPELIQYFFSSSLNGVKKTLETDALLGSRTPPRHYALTKISYMAGACTLHHGAFIPLWYAWVYPVFLSGSRERSKNASTPSDAPPGSQTPSRHYTFTISHKAGACTLHHGASIPLSCARILYPVFSGAQPEWKKESVTHNNAPSGSRTPSRHYASITYTSHMADECTHTKGTGRVEKIDRMCKAA